MNIDKTDIKILRALTKDAKMSIKELAEKANLSATPVYERIKKMEKEGIIEGYSANINPQKIGLELVVYMQVKLIRHQEELFEKFAKHISQFEEVVEAVMVSGEYDALLKLYLKDMNEYHEFVSRKISKIDIISNVISSFAINKIKGEKTTILPRI